MKVGVTQNDLARRDFVLGQYDFNTRQFDLDDGLVKKLQIIADLHKAAQQILEVAYYSSGKTIPPSAMEQLECLNVEVAEEATPARKSAKTPKQKASAADSSSA